jgi:hypothetical protein
MSKILCCLIVFDCILACFPEYKSLILLSSLTESDLQLPEVIRSEPEVSRKCLCFFELPVLFIILCLNAVIIYIFRSIHIPV